MKIKVLIIENEKEIAEQLKLEIEGELGRLSRISDISICVDFALAVEQLRSLRPHIVVLDILKERLEAQPAAQPAWQFIRDEHFCPVIFYSANPMPEGFPAGADPFACYHSKTNTNPDQVAKIVGTFIRHVDGLQKIRDEIESQSAKTLQKVTRLIWNAEADPAIREQALLRVTRRRLAAALEYPLAGETHIKAWEQFIYPPIDPNLLTGDVLRRIGGQINNPSDYRVILTPPCDLVVGANRHPVNDVLVAQCVRVNDAEILRKCKSLETRAADLPQRLGKKLKEDRLDGMLVLPALTGVWPVMVVDFKSLDLVPRSTIAPTHEAIVATSAYERIASMDSPYRESLSWRFTQTAGRPGLPEIDEQSLATDVQVAAALQA
ncbi:MAG TPA: hypothetical protein VGY98_09235 [Verrucomicrobiae bacterium]|nr:hypothetical protein [Verrucomicrobiae bacterium]